MKKKYLIIFVFVFSLIFAVNCFAENSSVNASDNEIKNITAIAIPDAEPYISFIGGHSVGIVPDTMALIADEMGVRINIIQATSFEQYIEYIESGNYDIVLDGVKDNSCDYFDDYYFTEPYIDVIYSRVSLRQRKSGVTKVAMVDERSLGALYSKKFYYPEQIEYCGSIDKCFDAVKDGECTEMVINSFAAEKIVNDDLRNKYISVSMNKPLAVRIAVNKKLGEEFVKLLNTAIENLDQTKITNIVSMHTMYVKPETSIIDRLYANPTLGFTMIALISVAVMLFVILAFVVVKHRGEVGQRELLKSALANEENANNAKSQFLARMSHEIRTPMNAIVGLVALARERADDKKAVLEYLDKIDSASDMLLSLINDVLDMSAIESNKFKIANNKFDFKKLMSGISSMYYSQCSAKNVHFNMQITDVTEEVLIGDSLRLNQILLNLISNAVKFTDDGGSINFNVIQTSKTDEYVYMKFIVRDNGCGMNEDMLSRVFKPFEQESTYNTRKYGGSGLGLSIVKSLVDMMHGAITVESEKDVGTTFTVDMPFGITGETTSEQTKKFSSVKALIVDANRRNCEFNSEVLKSLGVKYDIANSSEKAIDALGTAHASGLNYDICFVEYNMPNISGTELTKKIKSLFFDDIAVVIVSPYYTLEAEHEAKAAGANMFITKSIYQPKVFDVLMTISEKKKAKLNKNRAQYDFSGYKVLLAEDNELNREIAVALLKISKLSVDYATNGKEAVDMFLKSGEEEYAAVLMDIQMPVMDGYEAAKTIRASEHPDAQKISIYAMTANTFTEDVSAALSSGMNGHISKPINTVALYEAINESINKEK